MPGTNRVGFRDGPIGLVIALAGLLSGCGGAQGPPVVDVSGPVQNRPARTASPGHIEKVQVERPSR